MEYHDISGLYNVSLSAHQGVQPENVHPDQDWWLEPQPTPLSLQTLDTSITMPIPNPEPIQSLTTSDLELIPAHFHVPRSRPSTPPPPAPRPRHATLPVRANEVAIQTSIPTVPMPPPAEVRRPKKPRKERKPRSRDNRQSLATALRHGHPADNSKSDEVATQPSRPPPHWGVMHTRPSESSASGTKKAASLTARRIELATLSCRLCSTRLADYAASESHRCGKNGRSRLPCLGGCKKSFLLEMDRIRHWRAARDCEKRHIESMFETCRYQHSFER